MSQACHHGNGQRISLLSVQRLTVDHGPKELQNPSQLPWRMSRWYLYANTAPYAAISSLYLMLVCHMSKWVCNIICELMVLCMLCWFSKDVSMLIQSVALLTNKTTLSPWTCIYNSRTHHSSQSIYSHHIQFIASSTLDFSLMAGSIIFISIS